MTNIAASTISVAIKMIIYLRIKKGAIRQVIIP